MRQEVHRKAEYTLHHAALATASHHFLLGLVIVLMESGVFAARMRCLLDKRSRAVAGEVVTLCNATAPRETEPWSTATGDGDILRFRQNKLLNSVMRPNPRGQSDAVCI